MIEIEEEFENENEFKEEQVIKSKRGRKSKKELMETLNLLNVEKEKPQKVQKKEKETSKDKELKCKKIKEIIDEEKQCKEQEEQDNEEEKEEKDEIKVFKKRGRKPKGGKIIQQTVENNEQTDEKQNIILHLKCSMADLENNDTSEKDVLDAYNTHIYNDLMNNYKNLDEPKITTYMNLYEKGDDGFDGDDDMTDANTNKESMKEIWKKIKQLECNLHMDNISKKSSCFWDTCDFDNPPIYIPKYFINGIYHVYGCFCCPECAVAYLNNEHIDRSTKAERYQLIHDLYSKVYDYKRSIKEASDPRYLLDKFVGNLSIKEYRNLLRSETLYLVIDKPLTKVYPELHENTEDYILNNKIIPSNTSTYQIRGKNGKKKPNKTSILSENFGIN